MIEPLPSLLTPDQFNKSMSGTTEFWRTLAREPEFQLTHSSHSAGGFKVNGVNAHGISVQCSTGTRHTGRYDGRQYTVWAASGMSWTRPAGVAQVRSWKEPIEVVTLWLAPELWSRTLRSSGTGAEVELVPRFVMADPFVEQATLALKKGAELSQPFGRLLQDGLLTALIAHLANQGTSDTPPAAPRGGLADWRLRRVLDHMEDHLAEDISLAELAALAGQSERHFCQAFRQTMGTPPHRYLVERRIARAKSLFRSDRTLSVIEVALAVGFTASTHFATMFRKVTGGTPTAYRNTL